MLKYLIVGLVILLAVIFVIYTFFSYFLGISGTRSSFEADKQDFVDFLNSIALVPWKMEELDILSRDGEMDRSEGLLTTTEKGVIYSIFKEPLIAYAVRTYRSTAKKSMAIRIADKIYEYELNGKKLFVRSDGQEVGHIIADGPLKYASPEAEVIIDISHKGGWIPALIDGDQAASVRRFEESDEEGRLVQTLSPLTKDQSRSFLVLLAFAIVDEQI